MAKENPNKSKARGYYLTGEYTQIEIAEMTGVTPKTIGDWKAEGDWESLKESMLTSRENELKNLYKILKNVNEKTIEDIDAKRRVNPKDADAVIKYTAAIKNLELETSIADKVEIGTAFINDVRKTDMELAKVIAAHYEVFLKSYIK